MGPLLERRKPNDPAASPQNLEGATGIWPTKVSWKLLYLVTYTLKFNTLIYNDRNFQTGLLEGLANKLKILQKTPHLRQ